MRGGTSKAVVLRGRDLPEDPAERDRVILGIFGSPDRRQIDGLGGADPLTSKLAVVDPPTRTDADVDYTFAQVGIMEPRVDYGGNCGNISAAVAAYAVDEGLVAPTEPFTPVRIHNTNTRKIITAYVPVTAGRASWQGDFAIAGVPGTGACIRLDFAETVGSCTGRLLPTGNIVDRLAVPDRGELRLSVVDVAGPMIFVAADALGIATTAGPDDLDRQKDLLATLEKIRVDMARRIGLTDPQGFVSDNVPLIAVVAAPAGYRAFTGQLIPAEAMDLWSREMFRGATHKAYGVTETICTAIAASLEGTIVHHVLRRQAATTGQIRIGHPSGVIEAEVALTPSNGSLTVQRALVGRTARRLMDGYVHVPDRP